MLLGATVNELLLVGVLLLLVALAPKVPRIGERIGAAFERNSRPRLRSVNSESRL